MWTAPRTGEELFEPAGVASNNLDFGQNAVKVALISCVPTACQYAGPGGLGL
jgi:hypothetical protein